MKVDEKLTRVYDKLDIIVEHNSKQDIGMAKITEILDINTQSLKEHMKRSDTLEKHVSLLEKSLIKHLSFVRGACWVMAGIITVATALSKLGYI